MDIYLKTIFTVLEVGSGRAFISAMCCLPEAAALQWEGWDLRTGGHLFKLVACSSTVRPPSSFWSLPKSLFTGGAWDPDSLHAWEEVRVSSRRPTLIQLCSFNQAKKRVLELQWFDQRFVMAYLWSSVTWVLLLICAAFCSPLFRSTI